MEITQFVYSNNSDIYKLYSRITYNYFFMDGILLGSMTSEKHCMIQCTTIIKIVYTQLL